MISADSANGVFYLANSRRKPIVKERFSSSMEKVYKCTNEGSGRVGFGFVGIGGEIDGFRWRDLFE